jgi:hypothetical protein
MAANDFDIPEGLSELGQRAARAIVAYARHIFGPDSSGGGCRAFYTPQEWRDRGEQYGLGSELIVVYDGGDLYQLLNMDAGNWSIYDEMDTRLRKQGVYAEECTCWYGAIYQA